MYYAKFDVSHFYTESSSATVESSTAANNAPSSSSTVTTAAASLPPGTEEGEGSGAATSHDGGADASSSVTDTTDQPATMDVGAAREEKMDKVRSKTYLVPSLLLESVSEQLQLNELWQTLSECLDFLAQTSDPHAVLILQPTVEAFFIVHANCIEVCKLPKKFRSSSSRSRLGQLSSFRVPSESGDPASPAPRMDFSPIPSTPGLAKGEEPYSHLPPETARFLMFAGTGIAQQR